MSFNDDIYKEQAEAERAGLEGPNVTADTIARAVKVAQAKGLLMNEYPEYPGAREAIKRIAMGDEVGKAFETILQVEEAKDVFVGIVMKISDELGDVATVLGLAYIIAEIYDAMENKDPKNEGDIVVKALYDALLPKGIELESKKV
jgi:hypothetical protein